MKASEARELASDINSARVSAEYDIIKQAIRKNAHNGKFSIVYDGSLLDENNTKLTEEGYKVKNFQSGINEYSYEISW